MPLKSRRTPLPTQTIDQFSDTIRSVTDPEHAPEVVEFCGLCGGTFPAWELTHYAIGGVVMPRACKKCAGAAAENANQEYDRELN